MTPDAEGIARRALAHLRLTISRTVVAASLVGLCCTGCSPRTAGSAALFVEADGTLVVQMAICDGSVSGITLWHEGSAGGSKPEDDVKRVDFAEPRRRSTSVDLGRVTPGSATLDLETGLAYHVLAGADDDEWSLASATFAADDIRGLRPGELLVARPSGSPRVILADPGDWADRHCEEW